MDAITAAVDRPGGQESSDTALIHLLVEHAALRAPDALAVADAVYALTYRDLDSGANALAHRLRDLGVRPGVLVGLCHQRSVASVVGALAVLKAGGAYVGLDPSDPDARLRYMLEDAGTPVLLAEPGVIDRLAGDRRKVVDLDEHLASGDAAPAPPDDGALDGDVAYVIYTSGSTGAPKGVVVSHASLVSLVDWHRHAFEVTSDDRASMLASPAFDASVWELWPYLAAGASVHIPDHATVTSPLALREWLVATEITIGFVPTPMAEALLDLDWPAHVALRTMLTGGDRLHRRPPAGTPFTLVNNYGVTEATVVSTSGVIEPGDDGNDLPSIGRAIAGTTLAVLGEDGRPVADGVPGELHVAGPSLAIGYLNRQELTTERFVDVAGTRMYRTGDCVRITPEGDVHFLGRLDTQVKIRGHRVELDEVAAVLGAHPAVGSAAAAVREDEPGRARLVAYLVPLDGALPDRRVLRDHAAERLPDHMVPTAFVELAALPVTRNGKLDRDALPAPSRESAGGGGAAARTPVEAAVSGIIEELLELEGVGRDDNFFDLGGHSLLGAQLIARVQEQFGVELTLLTIFDNPTVEEMAAAIDSACGP